MKVKNMTMLISNIVKESTFHPLRTRNEGQSIHLIQPTINGMKDTNNKKFELKISMAMRNDMSSPTNLPEHA